MKLTNLFTLAAVCCGSTLLYPAQAQTAMPKAVKQIHIDGYTGQRINDCITHRVKAQDVDHLTEPFRHQNETRRWQSEFWGKWILGAIGSYQYNQDPELLASINDEAGQRMDAQLENGYIGN